MRARVRIAIAFFGAILALVSVTAPVSAEPTAALSDEFGSLRWMNWNSKQCILAQGGADNQPVVQYTCLGYADQRWRLYDKGNDQYQIRNENSGKCLLVRGTDNNAPAVQFSCLDFADQYWKFLHYPVDGLYWVQNVNSGKCLIVRGDDEGAQLQQFDCWGYHDQAWFPVRV
jgi:hypothetical protein